MADPIFADPRLAALYDILDDDRSDLDMYAAIVADLDASRVLDLGCGTGTFACRLALDGIEVVGIDPAGASLTLARDKPGGDRVRWISGEAAACPPLGADLAVMTGNVAQVFVSDSEWARTLAAAGDAVRDGGWLVFETRDPVRRAWETWSRDHTYRDVRVPGVGRVETWIELIDVSLPFVSFRHTFRFHADAAELTSDSTLRFRERDEVTEDLVTAGFDLRQVRDAPDRPTKEFVFLAQRSPGPSG